MSITVNGQSCVPPGFRFHPTEEELLGYYLRKKVACEKIDLDVIRDVDLNKLEPWDIQDKCRIGSTPQNDWYFFSHKDKKYPTGTRTNRATSAGFWKATGRDKVIYAAVRRIGMRKTLVFYKGRAPNGQKSDWIMHEYRLDEQHSTATASLVEEGAHQEEGWVICRVFKKKNVHHKSFDLIPGHHSSAPSDGDGTLSQILHCMGRSSCKEEIETLLLPDAAAAGGGLHQKFMKLQPLHSPASDASVLLPPWLPNELPPQEHLLGDNASAPTPVPAANGWAALDRLLASTELDAAEASSSSEPLACFDGVYSPARFYAGAGDYHQYNGGDGDLWSLARSASNHIGHVSL